MNMVSIDIISRTTGNNSQRSAYHGRESVTADSWKIDEIYWVATANPTHKEQMETLITINMKMRNVKVGVIHGIERIESPWKQSRATESGEPGALPLLTKRTWCSPMTEA
ncbi:hypothetical protein [Undibacterium sp. TS12]|uniref:hypothetical protein n=1 Tax=Undibacterium sp. TS12 TaxID=2908202 RepID=UPI001F4C96D6|nr:hypothetical protein [Undibacterium sp. TS12]MCH8622061.1 hypothetical protein [Undibacterium sp. TS12]